MTWTKDDSEELRCVGWRRDEAMDELSYDDRNHCLNAADELDRRGAEIERLERERTIVRAVTDAREGCADRLEAERDALQRQADGAERAWTVRAAEAERLAARVAELTGRLELERDLQHATATEAVRLKARVMDAMTLIDAGKSSGLMRRNPPGRKLLDAVRAVLADEVEAGACPPKEPTP